MALRTKGPGEPLISKEPGAFWMVASALTQEAVLCGDLEQKMRD